MQTRLTELLGLRVPIVQAPMGAIAEEELVCACCKAGALGLMPVWPLPRDVAAAALGVVQNEIKGRPFGVNLNVAFGPATMLELALELAVPVIHFFWGDAAPFVARAKSAGAKTMATVASAREARRA